MRRNQFQRVRIRLRRALEAVRQLALYSLNGAAPGILNLMHAAQRFENLLDTYRRPDGSRWTGQQLDEATGGVVTRSYVTNLRKGRIENQATRRCGR